MRFLTSHRSNVSSVSRVLRDRLKTWRKLKKCLNRRRSVPPRGSKSLSNYMVDNPCTACAQTRRGLTSNARIANLGTRADKECPWSEEPTKAPDAVIITQCRSMRQALLTRPKQGYSTPSRWSTVHDGEAQCPHRQATESLVPIDRTDTSTPKSSDPSSDRSGNEGRQAMRRPRSRSTGPRGGKGNRGLRRHSACRQPWAVQGRGIAPVPPVSVLSLHDSRKAEQRADPVLPLVATVDTDKCIGCGTCEEVCPIGAISVAQVAKTDPKRCQGCGLCVTACPAGAISMRPMRLPDKQSASG